MRLAPPGLHAENPPPGGWLTCRRSVTPAPLARLSQPHAVTLEEPLSPWRNRLRQVSMLHGQGSAGNLKSLATTFEGYNPIADSPTYLGLRSTRKCNFGVNLGKKRKSGSQWQYFEERKKCMINHLIINHSFLRVITQLLVTSRPTQKVF